MISTNYQSSSKIQRIKNAVSVLLEERPFLEEEINFNQMVDYLYDLVGETLTDEQFYNLSDEELKENCRFAIATEVMSKMSGDLTPEQSTVFEEAIKRQ